MLEVNTCLCNLDSELAGLDQRPWFQCDFDFVTNFKSSNNILNLDDTKKILLYLNLIKQIRYKATTEFRKFKERWEKAVEEDKNWVDPYERTIWGLPRKMTG